MNPIETKTVVEKSRSGWHARTSFDLGEALYDKEACRRVLTFNTWKHSSRPLVYTSASCALTREDGCTVHALYGDFSKNVMQDQAKCTEKNVRAQHAAALAIKDTIIAEARAFYDKEKEVVRSDIDNGAAPALATNQTVREITGTN